MWHSRALLAACLLWCAYVPGEAVRGTDFLRHDMDVDYEGAERGARVGMSLAMDLMRKHPWQLQPCDFSNVKDRNLRKHLESIIKDKPVDLVLAGTPIRGKEGGFRARGLTADKKKVRARWAGTGQTKGVTKDWDNINLLSDSYDDVLRSYNADNVVDLELKLPPVKGSSELPTLVYSVVMGLGVLNPDASVTRAPAKVSLYPKGRPEYPGQVKEVIELGKAYATNPFQGNGLVDSQWAKGRAFFRKGRSVGQI